MSPQIRRLCVITLGLAIACGPASPSVLEFVEISPAQPRIGDVVTVRFRVFDERGVPLAGHKVNFKLDAEKAGITLNPSSSLSIKGTGLVETQLIAHDRVNSVVVVATSGDKQVLSPPITFAGTVASGLQFTFQCGELSGEASGGRHAIGAYDETRSMIAGVKLNCTAHVGDRNGDGVSGALVSFMTEAGTIGPSEVSQTSVIGNATILYKTSLPLPVETAPGTFSWTPGATNQTGELLAPLWMHPFAWSANPLTATASPTLQEPRRPDPIRMVRGERPINNPRDNLVTMIAVTTGEEGFIDQNNNGTFDPGETFFDLAEPFVDANDDGICDATERFIDANGNGVCDVKNGQWDANTLIWVQERIIWTGIPHTLDALDNVPGVIGHIKVFDDIAPASIALRCPTPIPTTAPNCTQAGDASNGYAPFTVTTYIADPWFNSLAQNADSDGCLFNVGDDAPVKLRGQDSLGVPFTYPPGRRLNFMVGDARDPKAKPEDQVPYRSPPIGFAVQLSCSFTASPVEGHVVKIIAGTITGSIE